MINSSQSPLPDNTQHSKQTDIHAPGRIRTHDLSRRAAEDLRLRPRGHWDRLTNKLQTLNYFCKTFLLIELQQNEKPSMETRKTGTTTGDDNAQCVIKLSKRLHQHLCLFLEPTNFCVRRFLSLNLKITYCPCSRLQKLLL